MMTVAKKWSRLWVALCVAALALCAVTGSLLAAKDRAAADGADAKAPIASYTFDDPTNPGLDSAGGGYNLEKVGGTIAVDDGVAVFDAAALKGILPAMQSFTVNFDIKLNPNALKWSSVLGLGYMAEGATGFALTGQDGAKSLRIDGRNINDSAGNALTGAGYYGSVGHLEWKCQNNDEKLGTAYYHGVSVVIDGAANTYTVYTRGRNITGGITGYTGAITDNLVVDDGIPFALGAIFNDAEGGTWNSYNYTSHSYSNMDVFNYAMTAAEVADYWANDYSDPIKTLKAATYDFTDSVMRWEGITDADVLVQTTNGVYTVTTTEDKQVDAQITWDAVVQDGDAWFVEGTVVGVDNPENIKARAAISTVDAPTALAKPFAKYEFPYVDPDDADAKPEDAFVDSMGNFDLKRVGSNRGVKVNRDGVATFDGTGGLIAKTDFTDKLRSFTLAFDIKLTETSADWTCPISIGDNGAGKWLHFDTADNSDMLRFAISSGKAGGSTSDIQGQDAWWAQEVGALGSATHSVLLSVDVGGNVVVTFDGKATKVGGKVPADFALQGDAFVLTLGGEYYFKDGEYQFRRGEKVELSNVALFDYAMTAYQMQVYSADGTATVGATRLSKGWITEIGSDVTMGDGEGLKEDMTESEMLAILTESGATVSATRSNGTATPPAALKLPVVWTEIVQSTEGGNTVWTAQGYAEVVGLGIATTVARTPVHKTLDVEQMCAVTVASGIENGTVTVSAAKAFVGEEIIITVTPAEGYEIGRVTVNGSAITADDGVYKMTVSGDMTVSAEFTQKTQGGDNKPDDNDPDNNPGGNDGPNGTTDAGCGCGAFVGTTTALSLGALLLLGAILFAVARRSTKRNR